MEIRFHCGMTGKKKNYKKLWTPHWSSVLIQVGLSLCFYLLFKADYSKFEEFLLSFVPSAHMNSVKMLNRRLHVYESLHSGTQHLLTSVDNIIVKYWHLCSRKKFIAFRSLKIQRKQEHIQLKYRRKREYMNIFVSHDGLN